LVVNSSSIQTTQIPVFEKETFTDLVRADFNCQTDELVDPTLPLKQEILVLKESNANLTTEISNLKSESQELTTQKTLLDASVEEFKGELEEIQKVLENCNEKEKSLKSELWALQELNTNLTAEVEKKNSENEEFATQKANLDATVSEFKGELEEIQKVLVGYSERETSMKSELFEKEQFIQKSLSETEELRKSSETLSNADISRAEDLVIELKLEIETLKTKISEIEGEQSYIFVQKQVETDRLSEEIEKMQSKNSDLCQNIANLNTVIQNLEKSKQEINSLLSKKVTMLEDMLEVKRAELQKSGENFSEFANSLEAVKSAAKKVEHERDEILIELTKIKTANTFKGNSKIFEKSWSLREWVSQI
jgi:chromosome segregation ATPase